MSNNFIDLIYAKNKDVQQVIGEHSDAIIFGDDGSLVIKSEGKFEKTVIPTDPKFTDTIDSSNTIIDKILIGVQDADNARKLEIFSGLQGKLGHQGTQGIQGDQGAKGAQGIQGQPGTQGIQGDQGAKGTQGIQGQHGTQGIQGDQGAKGTQGIQGDKGANGTQGIQGDQGIQGTKGANGTQGIQGDQGAKGTQGIQGNPGAQGDKGVNGPNGSQGDKGPQGDQGVQGAPGTGINLTEVNGTLKYNNSVVFTESNAYNYIDPSVNINYSYSTNPIYVTGIFNSSITLGRANGLMVNTNVYWKQESASSNATAYLYTSSDLNLKENLQPISKEFIDKVYNSIDLIYDFNWKNDPNDKTTGFIAQYLEELDPYLVNTNEEGIKAVNYNGALSKMVGVLLKKTKEQDQRINELENVVRKLLGTSI